MQAKRHSIFGRIVSAMKPASRHEREMAYLSGSRSLVDLEMRQREIDAGKFRY
jgi:hypothetical protein